MRLVFLNEDTDSLMIDILKRHGVNLFWTVGIFVVALLFYVGTSAFTPYPGLSAEYFSAICYPGSAPDILTAPLDTIVFRSLATLLPYDHLTLFVGLIYAAIGAGIVACLFRCAIATSRHACVDLTGIRDNELDRALFAISHVSFETGIATALLALATLPIWAIATRPYPQALTALAVTCMITFALEFRWRSTQCYLLSRLPEARHCILLALTYAFIAFITFTQPELAPVSLFAFVLASGIFLRNEAEGRGAYLLSAGAGLVVGLLLSIAVTAGWAHVLNAAQMPLPNGVALWGQHFMTGLLGLVPRFTAFEGLAPLIIFLSAAALFFGCFPHAYLKFGSPIIGQVACVGLLIAMLLQWPESAWELFCEPDAMSLVAGFMLTLCIGVLFGSWLHTGFGERVHWSRAKFRLIALLLTFAFSGSLAIYSAIKNAPAASGLPARTAMHTIAPLLDELVPETATLWMTHHPDTLGIVARRYISGRPIQPQAETFSTLTPASLDHHPFLKNVAASDPLIRNLTQVGVEPLRQYLLATAPELGILKQLPPRKTSTNTAQAAKLLKETTLGETAIGNHCTLLLNQLAAREHAACAIGAEPEAAATHLRLAHALDPENPSIPLSLAALEHEGVAITQAERNAARDVLEARPELRQPSEQTALLFEHRYGPVRAPGFCSASRLRRFQLGNAPAVLAEILALYRTDPSQLSRPERAVAILHLPADEVAQLLAQNTLSETDWELFFCLYPNHPKTDELYQQNKRFFSDNDALYTLFREKNSRLRERIADKMQSFFLRDGTFAYALYYVNALLAENKLEEAVKFVGGFNVRERLAKTPALAQELSCRVLESLIKENPTRARTVCEGWLRSEPRQYRLWTYILSKDLPPSSDPESEIKTCLRYYPLHPVATARYAEIIEKDLGVEVANRYRDAVKKATEEGSCLQKDTHAHRRL